MSSSYLGEISGYTRAFLMNWPGPTGGLQANPLLTSGAQVLLMGVGRGRGIAHTAPSAHDGYILFMRLIERCGAERPWKIKSHQFQVVLELLVN